MHLSVLITLSILFLVSRNQSIIIEKMKDGTYLLAAPKRLTQQPKNFKKVLANYIHLNPEHDDIDLKTYPQDFNKERMKQSQDKDILSIIQNLCVNGKDNLTLSQNLEQFKKGPCSPTILVPGILATSLVISIECEKLRKYDNGRIFKDCGWDTCTFLGINKPDDHYVLWVGVQLILKVSAGLTKCFGDIFGLMYDKNSKVNSFGARYSNPAGITSTWLGNDNYTSSVSQCGANSIRDISGYVSILSIMSSQCALKDYGRFLNILQAMGYVPGITLQPLPYDFRYGVLASQTPKLFPQVINNLYKVTGKKVVIIAHSLGTLHTLNGLAFFMDKESKNKMIRHYIPISPPWSGTVSALRNLLYGDPSYFTSALIDVGINKYAQMKFATTSGSTYDLFLRNIFQKFQSEPWLKQVQKRINYERQPRNTISASQYNEDLQIGEDQYPMDWFPSKYELCFDPIFKKNPFCETGFIDFSKYPIFVIKDKKYMGTDQGIHQILRQNLPANIYQDAISIWNQTKVEGKSLNDLPAPGVNTSVIYSSVFDTQTFYNFSEKPHFYNMSDNKFIEPTDIGFSPGDISVPSFSPLLFIAKWVHTQANGNSTVKAIEFCGNYKGKKQHYGTISCECYKNPFKNQLDCTHPCIISDKFLMEFLFMKITNQGQGYADQMLSEAVSLSLSELEDRKKKCLNLHPDQYL